MQPAHTVLAVLVVGALAVGALTVGSSLTADTEGTDGELSFRPAGESHGFVYDGVTEQPRVRGDVSNAGVYVADYDRDGDPDVLAIGGTEPILFENVGGAFNRSGALPDLSAEYVRTALFLDHDNDGWEELLVFPLESAPILLENDNGSFERQDAGFEDPLRIPAGAAAADYDRDGCLDVFVIQNGDWINEKPARLVGQTDQMDQGDGLENVLYRGTCGGFERVTDADIAETHWSLATSFVDLTGDGYPDIHVANDFNYDALYVNQQNGSFARQELPNTNRNGMASEVFDVNRDGQPDIFVTNIDWTKGARQALDGLGYSTGGREGNNLLVNTGNGSFEDRAPEYGVVPGRWGWAASAGDYDADGDLDLFHATRGHFLGDVPGVDTSKLALFRQSRLFERQGERFVVRGTSAVGMPVVDGRGTAALDFDADGDLDLIVANATGRFRLFENRGGGTAVEVRVLDEHGAPALGARVHATYNGSTRVRFVSSGSDFLSQEPRTVHFGLGAVERVRTLRVVWPDGTTRVLEDVRGDQRLVVAPNGPVMTRSLDGGWITEEERDGG